MHRGVAILYILFSLIFTAWDRVDALEGSEKKHAKSPRRGGGRRKMQPEPSWRPKCIARAGGRGAWQLQCAAAAAVWEMQAQKRGHGLLEPLHTRAAPTEMQCRRSSPLRDLTFCMPGDGCKVGTESALKGGGGGMCMSTVGQYHTGFDAHASERINICTSCTCEIYFQGSFQKRGRVARVLFYFVTRRSESLSVPK